MFPFRAVFHFRALTGTEPSLRCKKLVDRSALSSSCSPDRHTRYSRRTLLSPAYPILPRGTVFERESRRFRSVLILMMLTSHGSLDRFAFSQLTTRVLELPTRVPDPAWYRRVCAGTPRVGVQ